MAQLLNEMRGERVITEYALFGAVAQMRYTEPVATLDANVLVAIPSAERVDVLSPIYEFCVRKGYPLEGESIRVGAWPVQFIPVFSSLTQEALEQAATADYEHVSLSGCACSLPCRHRPQRGKGKGFRTDSRAARSGERHPWRARNSCPEAWAI